MFQKYTKIVSLFCLTAVLSGVWYGVFYLEAHRDLEVDFFDVGQGDAVFIQSPDGSQILIDGGPDKKVLQKLGETMPFWDRTIDLVILTHPHADHVTGLLEVLKRYRVDNILESGETYSTPEYQEWRNLIKEKNIHDIFALRGQKIIGRDFELDVLAPFESFAGVSRKNVHDGMVVGRLIYGKNSFLLAGDAEKPVEYLLTHSGENLRSDILKVGHHGSKTSTTKEFLDAVSPQIAVIQVGRKNRYGHPTKEVLDRLSAVGAKILRNDMDGDIFIESDGTNFFRK